MQWIWEETCSQNCPCKTIQRRAYSFRLTKSEFPIEGVTLVVFPKCKFSFMNVSISLLVSYYFFQGGYVVRLSRFLQSRDFYWDKRGTIFYNREIKPGSKSVWKSREKNGACPPIHLLRINLLIEKISEVPISCIQEWIDSSVISKVQVVRTLRILYAFISEYGIHTTLRILSLYCVVIISVLNILGVCVPIMFFLSPPEFFLPYIYGLLIH